MSDDLVTVTADTVVADALMAISEHRIRNIPVVA